MRAKKIAAYVEAAVADAVLHNFINEDRFRDHKRLPPKARETYRAMHTRLDNALLVLGDVALRELRLKHNLSIN
jgi:hypothetical protein